MERYKEIERSIIKKFRKEIWARFVKAVKDYKLINENDNVMVCISGGKDSFLLAKCIQELERHSDIKFNAHYVVMNPGYNENNHEMILKNADILNIPIEIFSSDIFNVVTSVNEGSPCYLCARMRRGYLYNKAKELGCNKIALGHHFDDVIETTLLSMLYGAEIKTMPPKLHSTNYEGLELIRPLYLVKESSIDEEKSKRKEMKKLINELRKKNKDIDYNIFKSMDNINLNCILGYKKDGKHTSFLDDYDK